MFVEVFADLGVVWFGSVHRERVRERGEEIRFHSLS